MSFKMKGSPVFHNSPLHKDITKTYNQVSPVKENEEIDYDNLTEKQKKEMNILPEVTVTADKDEKSDKSTETNKDGKKGSGWFKDVLKKVGSAAVESMSQEQQKRALSSGVEGFSQLKFGKNK